MIDTLVFSGGGIHGITCFIASINLLHEKKVISLKNIRNFRGTSAGALACLVFSLPLSPSITAAIISSEKIGAKMHLSVPNLFDNFGLNDGQFLRKFMEKVFKLADVPCDATFKEYYEKLGANLIFVASDLQRSRMVVFSKDETPNAKVLDAVMASCALPPMISPQKVWTGSGMLQCIDGALYCNFPIIHERIPNCNPQSTLGIYLAHSTDDTKVQDVESFVSYCHRVVTMGINSLSAAQTLEWKREGFFVLEIERKIHGAYPWSHTNDLVYEANRVAVEATLAFCAHTNLRAENELQNKSTQTS